MRTVIYNATNARSIPHVAGIFFQCNECRAIKPVQSSGGTGYGQAPGHDALICYACCGRRDRDAMVKTGKGIMYLVKSDTGWKLTNWPGTLTINPTHVRPLRHPFAREAYIAYFRFAGANWSAKNIGDNQIARCRRLVA